MKKSDYITVFCKLYCKWSGMCSWCNKYSLFECKTCYACNFCKNKNDVRTCYDCEPFDTGLTLYQRGVKNG